MSWTDEKRQQVFDLAKDGWSSSQIAWMVGGGVTRNAVIGVLHRAGMKGVLRAPGVQSASAPRAFVLQTPKTKIARQAPTPPKADLVAPTARRKDDGSHFGTADLRDGICKWPHGQVGTDGFHYCANECPEDAPYCGYHKARAWRPAPQKARAA